MVDSEEVDAFELSELSDALLGWFAVPAVVLISRLLFTQSVALPCAAIRFETVKTVDESLVRLACLRLLLDESSAACDRLSSAACSTEPVDCLPAVVDALSRLTYRLIGPEEAGCSLPAVFNCVSAVSVRGTKGRLAADCSSFDDDLLAIVWLDV